MPKPKSRGNGMGSIYRNPVTRKWTAEVVVGWRFPEDPSKPKRPVRKKKTGFNTKAEAEAFCVSAKENKMQRKPVPLHTVYLEWKDVHASHVDASTMGCYVSAYKHFSAINGKMMDEITPEDLQQCVDACPSGKRTRQNMRTTAGLLWAYAVSHNIVDKDITKGIYTGSGKSVQREPLTRDEEEIVFSAVGRIRYAEYVYCLCYLGFRPGEFLELRKDHLYCAVVEEVPIWYFMNGKKTEAGKNRRVVIPDKILPIILDRSFVPGTDLLFPMYQFDRKKEKFLFFKPMTDAYFREDVFKPMMKKLSIADGKVPYGARHTYANKLKKADGTGKDKSELIGHSSYLFTQKAYQSSELVDLKTIVESFE